MLGRTSGKALGRVLRPSAQLNMGNNQGSTDTYRALIETERLTQAGDSGGPVFNSKNELIGMAYAGGGALTYVMPIQPILEALGLTLATD